MYSTGLYEVYFTLLVLWLATIVAGQCLDAEENEAGRKD